jgi:hypothetical protein
MSPLNVLTDGGGRVPAIYLETTNTVIGFSLSDGESITFLFGLSAEVARPTVGFQTGQPQAYPPPEIPPR